MDTATFVKYDHYHNAPTQTLCHHSYRPRVGDSELEGAVKVVTNGEVPAVSHALKQSPMCQHNSKSHHIIMYTSVFISKTKLFVTCIFAEWRLEYLNFNMLK